jgi:restriction endonuclease Mrr
MPKSRLTPDEQIREGNRALRTALATELLDRVQRASPVFFGNRAGITP